MTFSSCSHYSVIRSDYRILLKNIKSHQRCTEDGLHQNFTLKDYDISSLPCCLRSCAHSRVSHHYIDFYMILYIHNNLSDFRCTKHFTGTYETEAGYYGQDLHTVLATTSPYTEEPNVTHYSSDSVNRTLGPVGEYR